MSRTVPTVLAVPRAERLLIPVVFPVLGALLGWAVLAWHDAWLALEWAPLHGPAMLLDRFVGWAGGWAPVVLVGAGVLAGLVLVATAVEERVRLEVDAHVVRVLRGSSRREYRRTDVREVLVDARDLVLVAHTGTELARVRTGFPRRRLAAAFQAQGYPWTGDAN